jgi:mono/diheme cytochrome c family protein
VFRPGLALVTALFAGVLAVTLHAQAPAPAAAPVADPDARIWAGVYTLPQAARGKAVYEAYCTRCHGIDMVGGRQGNGGGPPLAGDNFWLNWERAPLASLFSKVSKTMPLDSPGSLRIDDYADLLAYILSGNRFPAGAVEIPATGVGLDAVRIARQNGATGEAPNFALVQVVGCLTPAGGPAWTLTQATSPALTRDEQPTDSAVAEARTRPLGSDTIRLFSVAQYVPETKVGQKVEARGLLNRVATETRLDVLSLQPLGQSCGG